MDEEMRFHLEQLIAEKGREAALREFGNVALLQEQCRDERRTQWVENFWQDLRFGLRGLRRNPMFAATGVLSLALGIGGSAAVFLILDSVVLRPLPGVAAPDRLYAVDARAKGTDVGMPFGDFMEIRKAAGASLENSYYASPRYRVRLTTGGRRIDHVGASEVTHEFFSVLGVRFALGRPFEAAEDLTPESAEKSGSVAVISHGLWMREFGGDPKVLGKTVIVNQAPCRIVGVAAAGFAGDTVGEAVDVWIPLRPFRTAETLSLNQGGYYGRAMARLRDGATVAQAVGELTAAYQQLQSTRPPMQFYFREENTPGWGPLVVRGKDYYVHLDPARGGFDVLRSRFSETLYLMLGATLLVFLIGCANVANLLLSRGVARSQEVSVRRALGASPWRLASQVVTEALLLAGIAALTGLALARWGSVLLVRLVSRDGGVDTGLIDWRVALFLLGLTVTAVLIFASIPAWRQSRGSELNVRNAGARAGQQRTNRLLIATQIALSVILLSAATLLAQTIRNLRMQDFGFDPAGVVAVDFSINSRDKSPANAQSAAERLLAAAEGMPGVRSAALSASGFFSGYDVFQTLDLPGPKSKEPSVGTRVDFVSPGYFETMGIQLLAGRLFGKGRDDGTAVVVNEAFVRKFVRGDQQPLGFTFGLSLRKEKYRVVGVVRNSRYRNAKIDYEPSLFVHYAESSRELRRLEIRAANPGAVMPVVREVLLEAEPDAVIESIGEMRAGIDQSFHRELALARLAGAFSVFALVLSAIGIYGLMSYAIARRVHEFGVRMALGARPGQVFGLVLRDTAQVAVLGLALGIPGAWFACRFLEGYLFGVHPGEPTAYAASAFVIVLAAVAAAWFPARRAAKVDPSMALRAE
ncbi:hypothetical protein F183_A20790 [Bryobacterales bacterium F-183]|nr:hypothetical protein F183_A20790 [Bryobacterales bacterium F-183]